MSQPDDIKRDDPMIAAEYALGLLEGEDLIEARGKAASDTDFAARKAWWDNWFAPWTDEMPSAEPGAHVWDAISAKIAVSEDEASIAPALISTSVSGGRQPADNVVVLDMERKLRRWQWTAAITSAAAALALALFLTAPGSAPMTEEAPLIAAADVPLMASIPIGDTPLRLGVTYIPASEEMLVSASGLTADGVHDHELWLVPADGGALQSLGVVVPGEERRMTLPDEIASNIGDGVQLVLTREPIGGKPEGVDAGPVVAQGALGAV
ncbi:MAG: anti-sigma factor [Pseudomonadota bacterium]